MTIFKPIPGYEGIYEASSDGEIWTAQGKTTYRILNGIKRKRVWKRRKLKPKIEKRHRSVNSDYRVELWKNGQHTTQLVARLVAMAFHPNPMKMPCVNHIDGNSMNNKPSNLEWCSYSQNVLHAYTHHLNNEPTRVTLKSLKNGRTKEFLSMTQASRYLKFNDGYISNCLRKGTKKVKGYEIIV